MIALSRAFEVCIVIHNSLRLRFMCMNFFKKAIYTMPMFDVQCGVDNVKCLFGGVQHIFGVFCLHSVFACN